MRVDAVVESLADLAAGAGRTSFERDDTVGMDRSVGIDSVMTLLSDETVTGIPDSITSIDADSLAVAVWPVACSDEIVLSNFELYSPLVDFVAVRALDSTVSSTVAVFGGGRLSVSCSCWLTEIACDRLRLKLSSMSKMFERSSVIGAELLLPLILVRLFPLLDQCRRELCALDADGAALPRRQLTKGCRIDDFDRCPLAAAAVGVLELSCIAVMASVDSGSMVAPRICGGFFVLSGLDCERMADDMERVACESESDWF